MKIISNCLLCEEHSLHVAEQNNLKLMQCIHCGYVSTDKFIGTKKDNKEYQKLPDDLKEWSVEKGKRIWTPTMMTLPMGMLYPINDEDKVMKWGYAEMVDIPEEEQKNYPREDGEGFHTKKNETDDPKIYDLFLTALSELNQKIKSIQKDEPKVTEIKFPKLKKVK